MYLPPAFRVDDPAVLAEFIHQHPLAFVVSLAGGIPTVDHLPMQIASAPGEALRLTGHVARGNPLTREVADGTEILAVFRGHEHYISPNWYPSKAVAGKAVPTWNYNVVHVRGVWRWQRDAETLQGIVSRLTDEHEATQPHPWQVSDAPADYLATMLGAIVGFTFEVTDIVGKFKASQNRDGADRDGVRRGLAAEGLAADAVAALGRDPSH